jgi:uncharacterized protein (DUF885 family)
MSPVPDQKPEETTAPAGDGPATPRRIADRYVEGAVRLNPITATALGLPEGRDRLPDLSPAGTEEVADLQRATLAELADAVAAGGGLEALDAAERRCARLLRERLEAALALHDAGESLRNLSTLFSPVQSVRQVFQLMPQATDEDWDVVAARLHEVPKALASYTESLATGASRGLFVGPTQVGAVVEQLGDWLGEGEAPEAGDAADRRDRGGWFEGFVAQRLEEGPAGSRDALEDGAHQATAAVRAIRDWLRDDYGPQASEHGRDSVGAERYARFARYWTGADLDLQDAYDWAWTEFAAIDEQLRREAARVLPGATPLQAMRHLDERGEAIEGVEEVRRRLQRMMDDAIEALDGTHFDLAEPVRRVEAMIAPAGSAAAPYYTRPSLDFSRPGRTWLPTLGEERFPLWNLVSTWYHEGVPGHHLQLAQWVYVAPQLSTYQSSLGSVGANVEGWALYAERLMDELGYLEDAGARIGFLDAQQMRAVRVIVDIGMHLELEIPRDQGVPSAFAPGERWTPALAREFFGLNCGRPEAFLDSELVRYLGGPGQAISYKLGERAWLRGREAARRAHEARGEEFDLKAWHMAALSTGSLGLDDLVTELGAL